MVLPQLAHLSFHPTSLLSFLEQSAHNSRRLDWENRLKNGLVVDQTGQALPLNAPYVVGQRIHYWRDAGAEQRIPFEEHIVYFDGTLLVVDKPHFLPVTPSGGYVQETLLVRLKKRSGYDELTPIHRIDRDTAGLVMFCVQSEHRDAYARIFREKRSIEKSYECIAPYAAHLDFPILRKTRLVPSPDCFMQMTEVLGEANSESYIELLSRLKQAPDETPLAHYRIQAITGKRHQLRAHMNALGVPICGDGIYPVLTPEPEQPRYDKPLQLLAKHLTFKDPVTFKRHYFQSSFRLELLSKDELPAQIPPAQTPDFL